MFFTENLSSECRNEGKKDEILVFYVLKTTLGRFICNKFWYICYIRLISLYAQIAEETPIGRIDPGSGCAVVGSEYLFRASDSG